MNDVHRFCFWKKYGPMVQKELNTMKTIATQSIRTALMPGKEIQCLLKLNLNCDSPND